MKFLNGWIHVERWFNKTCFEILRAAWLREVVDTCSKPSQGVHHFFINIFCVAANRYEDGCYMRTSSLTLDNFGQMTQCPTFSQSPSRMWTRNLAAAVCSNIHPDSAISCSAVRLKTKVLNHAMKMLICNIIHTRTKEMK